MRALDTNILVYAFIRTSAHHTWASRIVDGLAEGPAPWAIPWPCLHEFLATVTNRRLFPDVVATAAQAQVDEWLSSPSVTVLSETPLHAMTLARVMAGSGAVGARVHDAKVAAICIDHGVTEIITNDRDFLAFEELATAEFEVN
ncbi:MAG: PIN domain-containing protein [Herbiconiux sp.]|nr:PIN domain-containing protein [Herbiconiux sp.]